MELPKVTIQIVCWNSMRYLPACMKSIFDQTYKNFQVLVVDNNSGDGTTDFLRKNYPEVAIFENKKNLGFAKANNQGINLLHSPYVVFCNPDIVLDPDWLENIMRKVETKGNEEFGSFGGKLLRLKLQGDEFSEAEKTDRIDSCGLKIFKNHRIVELGGGERSGKFVNDCEVFGQSAALCLCRRSALMDLAIKNKRGETEYFDEDFFFYKEDVDLAWRLQLMGWRSFLAVDARAYHARSLSGSEKNGFSDIWKKRSKSSKIARYYSYRNHWFLIIKNQFAKNLFKYFLQIFWYELKKFGYILLFEWSSLPAVWQVIKMLPKMLGKRKLIFKKAKVGPDSITKWIS